MHTSPANNDKKSKRFALVTDIIDIQKFEHETDKLLLIGFFISVIFHSLLGIYFLSIQSPEKVVKPITVDLITVSRPRMTRPLILPERMTRPFTLPEQTFRKKSLTKKPFTTRTPGIDIQLTKPSIMDFPAKAGSSTVEISDELYSFLSIGKLRFPEDFIFEDMISSKPDEISLKEELITIEDIEASNEGQIKGLTIYNPRDKFSITGIVYIPHLYDSSWPPKRLSTGVMGLVDAVNSYTDIIGKNDIPRYFFSNRQFRNPFLYIGCSGLWEYKPFDVEIMREYIMSGGFVVFENQYYVSHSTPAEASIKQFIKDALGSQARVYPIPNDHPLYHCYFDFDDGPPPEAIIKNIDGHVISVPIDYIEGIFIGDRLVGIYSNKGWGRIWNWRGYTGTPQHRMGVNMVVYALRFKGGKATKKIDYALEPGINAIRSSFSSMHSNYNLKAQNP